MAVASSIFDRLHRIGCGLQGFMRGFEPWGIFLAIFGLLITLIAFLIEMEDRQAERTFRAWEFVLENEQVARAYDSKVGETHPSYGNASAQALVYLNREFEGRFCSAALVPSFRWLTGDTRRRCLIPPKQRSSLESRYLREVHFGDADLANVNLHRSDLTAANLAGANLEGARLGKAVLRDAMLKGANLSHAILDDAVLEDADLEGADLTRADLDDAVLEGADLPGREPYAGEAQGRHPHRGRSRWSGSLRGRSLRSRPAHGKLGRRPDGEGNECHPSAARSGMRFRGRASSDAARGHSAHRLERKAMLKGPRHGQAVSVQT